MLINNYVSEIAQLKNQQNNTDVAEKIEKMNCKICELMEQESLRFVRGKILYDEIKANVTTSGWSNNDYKCFIDYYKAIDFPSFCQIQKNTLPGRPQRQLAPCSTSAGTSGIVPPCRNWSACLVSYSPISWFVGTKVEFIQQNIVSFYYTTASF